MCEQLLKKWKLTDNNSNDFNNYMEAIGVSILIRKTACHLKPDVEISKNCDEWCLKTISTFKTTELKFKLDEVFPETTADGRKVQTEFTYDNGVLTQKQKWDGKESTITREVQDGRMVTTCIFENVKCVRIYDPK